MDSQFQSMPTSLSYRFNARTHAFSNTPASVHSRNLRCADELEQMPVPLSAFQWQPVLSTNKIAVIAARSGTRGLWQPNGWAGRGGSSGSSSDHSSSGILQPSSLVTSPMPAGVHDLNKEPQSFATICEGWTQMELHPHFFKKLACAHARYSDMSPQLSDTTRGQLVEPNERLDGLARAVVDAALEVHKVLGPGFAESVYEEALAVELSRREIPFERQVPLTVNYKGFCVGEGRADLLVGGELIIELKSVELLAAVHVAQVISYLKAFERPLGLLITFNVALLKNGIRRVVNSRR